MFDSLHSYDDAGKSIFIDLPIKLTSTRETPSIFPTARSIPEEHAEQVIPVISYLFIIKYVFHCSIVCTHMMMQAWELGIGSCWVGYYDSTQKYNKHKLFFCQERTLKCNTYLLVAILPLGYPSDESKPARGHFSVKPLKDTVKY